MEPTKMTITTSGQSDCTLGLTISIVIYQSNLPRLARTLTTLCHSVVAMRSHRGKDIPVHVFIVDNEGLTAREPSGDLLEGFRIQCTTIQGNGNVGYGRGHNIAIERVSSRYHLVLNPDVDVHFDAISNALDFLETHPEVGLLAPQVLGGDGTMQYLCRRYPTILVLFTRGFISRERHLLFGSHLSRYEMRDLINDREVVWDPPIISGCFMLFRTDVLKQLGGFDPRYFLYFEDYDLSLRAHAVTRIAYVPTVRILHLGGGAARKGLAHIRMFIVSAFRFFNRFGWKLA